MVLPFILLYLLYSALPPVLPLASLPAAAIRHRTSLLCE